MRFKQDHVREQLAFSHRMLVKMADYFMELSYQFGIEPMVTRVSDPVLGDSGVHGDKRAVDFRNEFPFGTFLYDNEQVKFICDKMNEKFERFDGKKTCIHHSWNDKPHHFHVQVAGDPKAYLGGKNERKTRDRRDQKTT